MAQSASLHGTHALGKEFDSAAQMSKGPGCVWHYLWGHALKRSPGISRKSRVSYPHPGFLSSATWPSMPKKHYNGLIINHVLNDFFFLSSYSTDLIQYDYIYSI